MITDQFYKAFKAEGLVHIDTDISMTLCRYTDISVEHKSFSIVEITL